MTMSCGSDNEEYVNSEIDENEFADRFSMKLQKKLDIIAHILDVPVDTLRDAGEKPYFQTRSTVTLATESECAALLAAFRQIADSSVRRRYLALLQSVAAGS